MTNIKHTTPQIPVKDFYSVRDVSILLKTSEDRIRELANREDDPLPFRRLTGMSRGMFIYRAELAEWVKRNTVLANVQKRKGPRDETR